MEKQAGAAGGVDGAGPNRKLWGSPTSGPAAGETTDRWEGVNIARTCQTSTWNVVHFRLLLHNVSVFLQIWHKIFPESRVSFLWFGLVTFNAYNRTSFKSGRGYDILLAFWLEFGVTLQYSNVSYDTVAGGEKDTSWHKSPYWDGRTRTRQPMFLDEPI